MTGSQGQPRPNHDELKVQHELIVARALVAYLRTIGCEIGDPRPGDITKREPDAVCSSPFGPLGIEVASGYYNDAAAKAVWDAVRRGSDTVIIPVHQKVLNLNGTLAATWSRTMAEHLSKPYSMPTYLVLDGTLAGGSRLSDLPRIMSRVTMPPKGQFPAIYVALLYDTDDGIKIEIEEIARW